MSLFTSDRAVKVFEKLGWPEWNLGPDRHLQLAWRPVINAWVLFWNKSIETWYQCAPPIADAIYEKWIREKLAERGWEIRCDGTQWFACRRAGQEHLGGLLIIKSTYAEALLTAAEACIAEEEGK